MGRLDGILGGLAGSGLNSLVASVIERQGGLAPLVAQFQEKGLGHLIQSWVSTGPNRPITPRQVEQALGTEALTSLAVRLGLNPADLAQRLSHALPQVVDRMTPGGVLPKY